MKKIFIVLIITSSIVFFSCKSDDKKTTTTDVAQTEADTLYKQVLDEHEEGMKGWMKIEGIQKKLKALQDSIAKFPSSAQYNSLKSKMNDVNTELSDAYKKMDVWMNEMNLDSAANNVKLRIQYLSKQKIEGSKITELINNSIQKADSLLKAKF